MRTVKFDSYSMLRKVGGETFDWCIFVASPADVVRTIRSVDYTLHSSFRDPLQSVSTPEDRFCLLSSGWGGFDVRIRVNFQDASDINTTFQLKVRDGAWPTPATPATLSSEERAIVTVLEDADRNRWRRLATLARSAGVSLDRALAILNDLSVRGVCRKAGFDALDGQALWGACSVIGALPKL
jgi:hypothetical protein